MSEICRTIGKISKFETETSKLGGGGGVRAIRSDHNQEACIITKLLANKAMAIRKLNLFRRVNSIST